MKNVYSLKTTQKTYGKLSIMQQQMLMIKVVS